MLCACVVSGFIVNRGSASSENQDDAGGGDVRLRAGPLPVPEERCEGVGSTLAGAHGFIAGQPACPEESALTGPGAS